MSGTEVRPSAIDGRGLFAARAAAPGETLAIYRGPVVDAPPPPDRDGRVFALALEDGRWIDGSGEDNPARFANHACDPSAEAVRDGDVIRLVARRDLVPGDEITFDYGFGLADALAHPCRCGAPDCPGRIVAAPLRGLLRRTLRQARQPRD